MAHKKKSKTVPLPVPTAVITISEHFEQVIAWTIWTILVALVVIAGLTATGVMMVLWTVVLHH